MTRVLTLSILLSLFVYPSSGQKDEAGELLKRVVANLKDHDLRSQNYTFTEDYHNINYDKKLKTRLDETAKYETVFIEGTPYRRKIEENGKPLSGKAAEQEETQYQATVAERRRINSEPQQTPSHREVRLPTYYEKWPELFIATRNGDEVLDGRQVTKLTLNPRTGLQPTSDGERDALQTRIQLWIDKLDEHPVRLKREYMRDGIFMLRGGTVELFWQKDANGTYLLTQALTRYRMKYLWEIVSGETDQQFSNYRRFSVDVKVTPESVPQ